MSEKLQSAIRTIIGRYGQFEEPFWAMLHETAQVHDFERASLLTNLIERAREVVTTATNLIDVVDELDNGLGQLSEDDLARVAVFLAQLETNGPIAPSVEEQPIRQGKPRRLSPVPTQLRRSKTVRVESIDRLPKNLQEKVRKAAWECCEEGAADTTTIRARVKDVTGVELSPRQAASYIGNYRRYRQKG